MKKDRIGSGKAKNPGVESYEKTVNRIVAEKNKLYAKGRVYLINASLLAAAILVGFAIVVV